MDGWIISFVRKKKKMDFFLFKSRMNYKLKFLSNFSKLLHYFKFIRSAQLGLFLKNGFTIIHSEFNPPPFSFLTERFFFQNEKRNILLKTKITLFRIVIPVFI